MNSYNNFKEFAEANQNTIFRYWVYKKPDLKYNDDDSMIKSEYISTRATFGIIHDFVIMPDGDILIGFKDPEADFVYCDYYKLSEIKLSFVDQDQDTTNEEDFLISEEDDDIITKGIDEYDE